MKTRAVVAGTTALGSVAATVASGQIAAILAVLLIAWILAGPSREPMRRVLQLIAALKGKSTEPEQPMQ